MPHVTGQGSALLLAACFTFGCAAIYEMPTWAQALTGILIRVALCLGPVVVVVALARWPAMQPVRPSAATALPLDGLPFPAVRGPNGCRTLSDRDRPGC